MKPFMTIDDHPLLEVCDLRVEFVDEHRRVRANRGVSLTVRRGELLAILGESGSGKSVCAQAIIGLLGSDADVCAEALRFDGTDVRGLTEHAWRQWRGRRISMIFQDSLASLNPVFTVGWQIAEVIRAHADIGRREARRRAIALLDRVRVPEPERRAAQYPHELSGGMRQRAMIAMALAMEPELLLADEPTTALDVTVQREIMELLRELQEARGLAVVLITHDIGVVAEVADRVVVMYAGEVVEEGRVADVLDTPCHPYTEGLIASLPDAGDDAELVAIPGAPPDLEQETRGCAFAPRCVYAQAVCREEAPPLALVGGAHRSACHFWPRVGGGPADG
ncbi:MAG: oligopeptide transport system ATP-binding protein [Solirubrobacteraceae bacterium]